MSSFQKMRRGEANRESNVYFPYSYSIILGFAIFLVTAFVLSPNIHEYSHKMVLDFYNCDYGYYNGADSTEIMPYCGLNNFSAILFMGAGVGSTSLLSLISFAFVFFLRRKNMFSLANIFIFVALGFASDLCIYSFATRGDLYVIFTIMGYSGLRIMTPLIGFGMAGIMAIFVHNKIEVGFERGILFSGISGFKTADDEIDLF